MSWLFCSSLVVAIVTSEQTKQRGTPCCRYQTLSDGIHATNVFVRRYVDFVQRRDSDADRDNATEQPIIMQDNNAHRYYTSEYYDSFLPDYPWVDLSDHRDSVKSTLLGGHLVAEIKELQFPFPFYGHNVSTVAVTTGGFIYMSRFIHQALAETQYVAPLMADFNLNLSPVSSVYYLNTTQHGLRRFTVQWDQVFVHEHVQNGSFTFQCILVENGTIIMLYKKMPISITSISTTNHPVTVGVADAFYVDYHLVFGLVRRYIYEYHSINVSATYAFDTQSSLVLQPIPNCVIAQSCQQCIANTNFNCGWCENLKRCSDGIDRHRQEWIDSNCSERAVRLCEKLASTSSSGLSSGAYAGIAVGILLFIAIVLIAVFVVYAYYHPTSPSGLWLIEHGPFWKKFQKSKEYAVSETP